MRAAAVCPSSDALRVDTANPYVDFRLPDGSRVNAVIRPVSIDGPSITIRKFKKDKLSIQQLIDYGSLNSQMAEFIRACVLAHLAAGRTPVVLAATDRALTRRVRAHLGSSGVDVRDESGWTLSTTRAAAHGAPARARLPQIEATPAADCCHTAIA